MAPDKENRMHRQKEMLATTPRWQDRKALRESFRSVLVPVGFAPQTNGRVTLFLEAFEPEAWLGIFTKKYVACSALSRSVPYNHRQKPTLDLLLRNPRFNREMRVHLARDVFLASAFELPAGSVEQNIALIQWEHLLDKGFPAGDRLKIAEKALSIATKKPDAGLQGYFSDKVQEFLVPAKPTNPLTP